MHCHKYAMPLVFSLISAFALGEIILKDDSRLTIPPGLFHNVSILENTSKRAILSISPKMEEPAHILFISQISAGKTAGGSKQILIDYLGLETLDLEVLSQQVGIKDASFFHITSNGPFYDFLLAERKLNNPDREVTFYLLAAQTGFYKLSPDFWVFSNNFKLPDGLPKTNKADVDTKQVVLAILVLIVNTTIIWLGLRKFGRYKLELI